MTRITLCRNSTYCLNIVTLLFVLSCLSTSVVSLEKEGFLHYQWDPETDRVDEEGNEIEYRTRNEQRTFAQSYLDINSLIPEDLSEFEPAVAAEMVTRTITSSLQDRIASVFEKATTDACRAKIAEHFGYYIHGIGGETSTPFADMFFQNQCPRPRELDFEKAMNTTYQPPRDEADYIDDANDLRLLYGILSHTSPQNTIRLIESLYEKGHIFVVHVDGKEASKQTYRVLVKYARKRNHVHVVPDKHRIRVNWGGYSMVNATMQILKYSFALLEGTVLKEPLHFHKFVHLSASSYPIASNYEIRHRLASFPLDANLMQIINKPTYPAPYAWNYYVECDDAVHRIYRLPPLTTERDGIDIYTSSQWFIISREFAQYMAEAAPGSLVRELIEYAEHTVIGDEAFFGTLMVHSKFCTKLHNQNFLFYMFDRWESDLEVDERDERKCLAPEKDRCGRSPTTMTLDHYSLLDMSGDLFARKFDDALESDIKDVLDRRAAIDDHINKGSQTRKFSMKRSDPSFEGHGVLIVASETVNSKSGPLCLGLIEGSDLVRLVPCFFDLVIDTLAKGWETGAVIKEEVIRSSRWDVGSCSSDGSLTRSEDGVMESRAGVFTPGGPHCMIKALDGARTGSCMESQGEQSKPGGKITAYRCLKKWHQFFAFGNGAVSPKGSIHLSVPKHIMKQDAKELTDATGTLCIGTFGRLDVKPKNTSDDPELIDWFPSEELLKDFSDSEMLPLDLWSGKGLTTIDCSNVKEVTKFIFVPFIVEDNDFKQLDEL